MNLDSLGSLLLKHPEVIAISLICMVIASRVSAPHCLLKLAGLI